MATKFIALVCIVGAANAGFLAPASPLAYSTVTSEQQNTLRSYGNLAQVSTFSKTIDTPFSSVAKSDVRVSNPGYVSSPLAYPSQVGYSAPLAYAGGYSGAPVAYSSPVAARVAAPALLGVAYSAAPLVSHMTYSNGYGIAYSY